MKADEKQRTTITYRVEYKAALQARELVEVRPGAERPAVAPLTKDERKAYLAATVKHYDFDQRNFQRWLDANKLRRGREESDVAFARRSFQFVKRCSGTSTGREAICALGGVRGGEIELRRHVALVRCRDAGERPPGPLVRSASGQSR